MNVITEDETWENVCEDGHKIIYSGKNLNGNSI